MYKKVILGGLVIDGDFNVLGVVGPYAKHEDLDVGAAILGPTSPTPVTVGSMRGLGFDADAELAFFYFHVPSDYKAGTNLTLRIHWIPEPGDALLNTETVKWNIEYYSIAIGEAIDNGTVATASVTKTQSGAGTDKEHILSEITIPASGGNQPVSAQDCIIIKFNRDFTNDTYSGDGIVFHWELAYTATGFGVH